MVQSFLLWLVVRHVTLLRSVNISQSWTLSFWNLYLASYLQISECVPADPAGQICRIPHNHSDSKLGIGYIYSTREILHNFSTYEAREKLRVRGTHCMSFAVAYMVWTGKWEGDWRERRIPVAFPFRSFPPPPLRSCAFHRGYYSCVSHCFISIFFFIPSLAIHYNPSSKGLAVATSEQIALLPLKNK